MNIPTTALLSVSPSTPASRPFWPGWMDSLRRMGVDQAAALVLDAAGPLSVLLAQMVYLGQPFVGSQASMLGRLLEDQNEARAFAAFLRGEDSR